MTELHHGFELLDERTIPEIGTLARLYRHRKSGAQLLSLVNDDENKVFGIAFATPSEDSTGIAHIMEHSVLCGSRKYPLKEPFVELIKGSLNTFLNAMTWPDHTVYPVASQSVTDLYNLADVYLDAVFYPNLTRWTFMQEGWHYELQEPGQPLRFKGVVFNEMKGNYSSPESMLNEYIRQSLFPDTLYGRDSGGDPAAIPDLDYDRFKAFHQRYYHPSNARIVFYGDDDPARRLRYLDRWLSAFDAVRIDPSLPVQPRWTAPRRDIREYDPGEDADQETAYVAMSWLWDEHRDPAMVLQLELLSHVLAGTPASPLRRALIESGLGEDVTGGAVDSDSRESFFTIGLSGVEPSAVEQVETLILETIAGLAKSGFEDEQVEASVNTIEFNLREANFGDFPRGIAYMIHALQAWLYGGDPLEPLGFERPLQAIKARLGRGEPLFVELLHRFFIANPHRSTVVMLPNRRWLAERDARENARLERVGAGMSEADLQRVVEETQTLQEMQLRPDPAEALAMIPALRVADLPQHNRSIPREIDRHRGGTVLFHGLSTNGIAYLDLGFDLRAVTARDVPYVGLIGAVLFELGTARDDFAGLARRIGRSTGGIHTDVISTVTEVERSTLSRLMIRGKSAGPQFEALLDILTEVLLSVQLDNRQRLKQILLEEKAELESSLVPGGRRFVHRRLRSSFNSADWFSEQVEGVSYLFFLRRQIERVDSDWPGLLRDLRRVWNVLLSREGLVVSLTADVTERGSLQAGVYAFLDRLPCRGPMTPSEWPVGADTDEGLSVPSQVNFVGKGADLYALGYRMSGSWLVAQNWLNTTYLWETVRVRGGAYGGSCALDPLSGAFCFLSYRDPNFAATVAAYDQAADFVRGHLPDQAEADRAIVGVIGSLDAYMLPDQKAYVSLHRYLTGVTDDRRQEIRDQVLSTTPLDFASFAEILAEAARCGRVVVLGSSQSIEQGRTQAGVSSLAATKVL